MSSSNNTNQKFKILALDGGGIRGVVTACILEEVRKIVGKPLNQYFDLIAGTSTGSIVAAGLAIGKEPEYLKNIYVTKGSTIFKSSWWKQNVSWLWGSKYSHAGLIKVLREELQDITIGEISEKSPADLLILAYDTLYRNTTFFHNKCKPNRWFRNIPLWEICVCSASAPTFFPPYELKWTDPNPASKFQEWNFPHIDGGIGANCPSLGALSHVMSEYHKRPEEISILAIGTGRTTEPLEYKSTKNWGKLNWAQRISDVFMGGQIQITTQGCENIIKSFNSDGYLRLQFEINSVFGEEDPSSGFRQLLLKKQRNNKYTGEIINEAMDDASAENIEKLIKAATKYAETKSKEIEHFIKKQQPVATE